MKNDHIIKILRSSHISEKSTTINSLYNQYVFKVTPAATKSDIKRAVELMFNVKVAAVRVVNVRKKLKTFGGRKGARKAWKKAYISLAAGQKIDLIGVQA